MLLKAIKIIAFFTILTYIYHHFSERVKIIPSLNVFTRLGLKHGSSFPVEMFVNQKEMQALCTFVGPQACA